MTYPDKIRQVHFNEKIMKSDYEPCECGLRPLQGKITCFECSQGKTKTTFQSASCMIKKEKEAVNKKEVQCKKCHKYVKTSCLTFHWCESCKLQSSSRTEAERFLQSDQVKIERAERNRNGQSWAYKSTFTRKLPNNIYRG